MQLQTEKEKEKKYICQQIEPPINQMNYGSNRECIGTMNFPLL